MRNKSKNKEDIFNELQTLLQELCYDIPPIRKEFIRSKINDKIEEYKLINS